MLAIAAVAACTPLQPSSEGPETDFWGNPIPAACAVEGGPVDPPPPPPGGPAPVPAGWRQVNIELAVNAHGVNKHGGISPVCVLFDVHVYGRADEVGLQFIEAGKVTETPWDGVRTTPWRASAILAYDPAARPQLVNWFVEILATYHPSRPDATLDPSWAPVQFSCDVIVDGRSKFVGTNGPNYTIVQAGRPSPVTCRVADQA